MINFSFASDCDLMTWKGYNENKKFFNELGFHTGDSFWLFDPSGGDMALFKENLENKGPYHEQLLVEIRKGNLDVMHSAGSYGERFNNGFTPSRKLIQEALQYLKDNAIVPKIWTNHGDVYNIQGISGSESISYRQGDNINSECYILDLLIEYGVEYFWLDNYLARNSKVPYKIITKEIAQDGNKIKVFKRFLDESVEWSGNGQNFDKQFSLDTLQNLLDCKQNTIFYTHWGCHHDDKYAYSPKDSPITLKSKEAFYKFKDFVIKNNCKVLKLYDFLKEEESKNELLEIERIAKIVVYDEKNKEDNFWYNQYNKHSILEFERRIKKLGVSGVALDAGCGVGQWSFAMKNYCEKVYGIEINSVAYKYLKEISKLTSINNPTFCNGNIEELPYSNNMFDWIICYGVIFCTNMNRTLAEFNRVTKREANIYICLNGDGWYEYLVDERFKDSSIEIKKIYSQPLFNAFLFRIGGYKNLFDSINEENLKKNLNNHLAIREQLLVSFENVMPKFLQNLINTYSDTIINLFALHILEEIERFKILNENILKETLINKIKKLLKIDKTIYPKLVNVNRAFLPEEFSNYVPSFNFHLKEFGSDGELSIQNGRIVKEQISNYIYESTYNNHTSVWECILNKS